ncbi:MAG TPA: Re/Si-specific NAD(P)(+) transhydrogenase subunit alpha [Gemmatimonadaceae bacterium]|nr:Re/Si-specific NAD(P)(+) transhydrogenase subunit alpha [Gemmatimonadaceae bacterium]
MKIGVPRETIPGEKRVAVTPEVASKLAKGGFEVAIETGAGQAAGFSDNEYKSAGAAVATTAAAALGDADAVLKVRRPVLNPATGTHEIELVKPNALLIGLLDPRGDQDGLRTIAQRGVTAASMELVPRITRAQMMDALSSQSTVAGYKAVLLAANSVGRFFPLLMTAAGTIRPAKVLVIGAGVAGLQAIATARRLGAVVEAFDTRPVVKEQVQSLGAKFVELDVAETEAQDAGGYAKELAAEHIAREKQLIHAHASQADVVITTALVPGRRAPVLISAQTVRAMRAGSAIVDLAAEQGGNCELSQPGTTVVENGVSILAPLNLPSELPYDASQMYARNVAALLAHFAPKGAITLDFNDEITKAVVIAAHGELRLSPSPAAAPAPAPTPNRPSGARV